MDILLSDPLLSRHPNVPAEMDRIISREESDDLLRVDTAPSVLPARKTISWRLSGPPVEGSAYVDLSRVVLWVDSEDVGEFPSTALEADVVLAQRNHQSLMVLFVGFDDSPSGRQRLSRIYTRLEFRYRAHCIMCETSSAALEQVYRISLVMNTYHVVLPHSPLFTDDLALTYLRMLLQLDGASVPQMKHVTRRFPNWRSLSESFEAQDNGTLHDNGRLKETENGVYSWVWQQLRELHRDSGC
ncbi:hypothetical protein V5O48_017134 [Marasmius crinis-equi]|uniref:Uncharacterized protein n=1 Tax=Marasmius crinis-equi TaxID=585013 RepID=A0ABR3EPY2_9AGAR